jgi:hypothetical protein
MSRPATPEARELYAQAIGAQGPAWANTAHLLRTGFENVWITPALVAIDRALDHGRQQDDSAAD